MDTATENGTSTGTTIIVTNSMQRVIDVKRLIEGIARDKDATQEMRRYARGVLGPLNALIAQGLAELS